MSGGLLLTALLAGATPAEPSGVPVFDRSSASIAPPRWSPALGTVETLHLSLTAAPDSICVDASTRCPAREAESLVTMRAVAPSSESLAWPGVQVAFVVETTPYDGVYDRFAGDVDPCSSSEGPLCEESNGVPFFVSHAQQIADAIQQANPRTNVSFAMVDYFATMNDHDDGDGQRYHVDIPQFITSQSFGAQVVSTFQASVLGGGWVYPDSDLSDNLLSSSSITALYGTIIGSELDWSPATHHVIVWMGSTAPEDSQYVENYTVSPSGYAKGTSASCEPSYSFGALTSPNCEGWVRSQDGNSEHSIAKLATSSPTCTESIGGHCTIDTIDLWTTPTDPYSNGWPCNASLKIEGGCPGGRAVLANVARVLLAGCDLAAATGGSWEGPSFFGCPGGDVGHLAPSFIGPDASHPNLENPSLFRAFRQIGFGPVLSNQVASGTDRPIFQFVPFGTLRVLPDQTIRASCRLPNGLPFSACDRTPTWTNASGVPSLSWNWSILPRSNQMHLGDTWTVSFLIYASGPPTTTVPVDACATPPCRSGGSGPIGGEYTWATYVPATNASIVTQSFPLASLDVQPLQGLAPPPVSPPPSTTGPPPPGLPIVSPITVPNPIVSLAHAGLGPFSLLAIAAAVLAAAFVRLRLRSRPMAARLPVPQPLPRHR